MTVLGSVQHYLLVACRLVATAHERHIVCNCLHVLAGGPRAVGTGVLVMVLAGCWLVSGNNINGSCPSTCPLLCALQYTGANTFTEQQKLANYNGTAIASKYGWHPQVGSAMGCTGLAAAGL